MHRIRRLAQIVLDEGSKTIYPFFFLSETSTCWFKINIDGARVQSNGHIDARGVIVVEFDLTIFFFNQKNGFHSTIEIKLRR